MSCRTFICGADAALKGATPWGTRRFKEPTRSGRWKKVRFENGEAEQSSDGIAADRCLLMPSGDGTGSKRYRDLPH
jgi:hypothetical protein